MKAVKHEIVKPLTFIINQSLKTGTFPDRLKVARVRPLFKKGDNQLITNYRQISILPSLSKIFEKVMHMQLTYYLKFINGNYTIWLQKWSFYRISVT